MDLNHLYMKIILFELLMMGVVLSITAAYVKMTGDVSIPSYAQIAPSGKIALTYDDGPNEKYTLKLLDLLEEKHVRASFFLLGDQIQGNEAVIDKMAKGGHLIGSHTYHHVLITSLNKQELYTEIEETSQLITDITGEPVEYIRPPYGQWDKKLEKSFNMIPVLWDIDTLDWQVQNTDAIVKKVMTNVTENDIILLHDSFDTTLEATGEIIDLLRNKGYEFVTVDELLLE